MFAGRARKPRITVVDFDDVESRRLRDDLEFGETPPFFWRMMNARFLRWIEQTESKLLQNWSGVVVCSEVDRAALMQRQPSARVQVVPNAVRIPDPALARREDGGFRVLFVGSLDFPPNVQGLNWLLEQVWPALRQALGERLSLEVVGFNPPADLQKWDGVQGVRVRGYVDDVEDCYARADLAVAPIFSGAGTRIKVIEAWSRSTPVVTTTIGCEGYIVRSTIWSAGKYPHMLAPTAWMN